MLRAIRCMPILLLSVFGAGADGIFLNEVLYDPEGGDAGHEFVELIGEAFSSLEGVGLEFCNGSDPGDWTRLWTGQPGDLFGADGLFLIGESALTTSPDAIAVLAMQNGPEAIRLTRFGGTLDLLGYGAELDPSLYEAWPAADAPSGRSLSRIPDGVDTDQNALDFFSTEPTPSRLNDPELELRIRDLHLPMPPPGEGVAWILSVEIENTGRLAWPSVVEILAGPATSIELEPLEAGERRWVELPMPGSSSGPRPLAIVARGEGAFLTDSLHLTHRVGLGPLLLSEVQFAPETGRSEWVECLAPEGLSVFGEWRLVDLGGYEASFPLPALGPGERIILCRDLEALRAEHVGLPAARLLEVSPWPSLSNEGENQSWPPWTDGLRLVDPQGLDSDGMLYRGDWTDRPGQSLERLYEYGPGAGSAWGACPRGSTPLAGPSPAADPASRDWSLEPQPFDPDEGAVEFTMRAAGGAARLRIFDAAGRLVQELGGRLGAGSLRLLWDGRDRRGRSLPSGAYPYLLSWDDLGGAERSRRGCCLILRKKT